MRRAPRVLYVLPRLELGGSERHIVRLAAAVAAAGGEALIVCLYGEGPLAAEARAGGTRVLALGLRGIADPRAMPALACVCSRTWSRPVFSVSMLAAWPARLLKVPWCWRGGTPGWMRPRHRLAKAGNFRRRRCVLFEAVRRLVLEGEGSTGTRRTIWQRRRRRRFRAARAQRDTARDLGHGRRLGGDDGGQLSRLKRVTEVARCGNRF